MDARLILDPITLEADLQLADGQIAMDEGLESQIIISLFTDARALPDDELPAGETDRRGWWGDSYAELSGDRIGSRLWLLAREKQLPEVVARARQYASEALQWLLDDDIAEAVEVEAEIVQQGVLGISVRVVKPRTAQEYRFQYAWLGQANMQQVA